MNPDAMTPYGLALKSYFEGQVTAELTIRRDDGVEAAMPVSHYFRDVTAFSPIETMALERCRGHVLDVGAGSGLHSLFLQSCGQTVTAIDLYPQSVHIMIRRGVQAAHVADVFEYQEGPFDTLLMLEQESGEYLARLVPHQFS